MKNREWGMGYVGGGEWGIENEDGNGGWEIQNEE